MFIDGYKYGGSLEGFPRIVVELMVQRAIEQGNRDVSKVLSALSEYRYMDYGEGGFDWVETPEGQDFWDRVVSDKDFKLFREYFDENFSHCIEF